MTTVSTICTGLGFFQRLSMGFMWDDWCLFGALIFAFGFLTTTALAATLVHAGYHINEYVLWELSMYMKVCISIMRPSETMRLIESLLQIALANNIIYNASITLSKASVLFLYYRIFGIDCVFRTQLYTVGVLLLGYFLAAFFGLIFATNPVRAQWNLTIPHTSIHNKAFWCSMGVINMVLDLIILAIPQARVWCLKLSFRRRILVSLVFLLGAL